MEAAIAQILEGNRAKKTVLQRKLGLLFEIGKDIHQTLKGGYRVWLIGSPSRMAMTHMVARFFHDLSPKDVGPPAIIALSSPPPPDGLRLATWSCYAEPLATACKKGDLLLALTSVDRDTALEAEIARLTSRGIWTVIFSSKLAKNGWRSRADRVLNLCTDDDFALLEMQLTFGYLLAKYVSEKLEGSPEPVFDEEGVPHDSAVFSALPMDTTILQSGDLGEVSAEIPSPAKMATPAPLSGSKPAAPPSDTDSTYQTAIRFRCESCGDLVYAEGRHRGKRGKCPRCQSPFRVPDVDEELLVANEVVERRRAQRFRLTDCEIQYDRGRYPTGARSAPELALLDISAAGLRLIKDLPEPGELGIDLGDLLFLSLDIPAFLDPIQLQAKVMRIEGSANRRRYTVSMDFVHFHKDAAAKLQRLSDNPLLRDIARA